MNPPATRPRAELDEVLARAVVYRFLAIAWRSVDGSWYSDLVGLADGLKEAVATLVETREGGQELVAVVRALRKLLAGNEETLRREHVDLFGHTVSSSLTPYETEWTGWAGQVQQFHEISDLGAFYAAHGLELDPDCHERADHLSVELEFLRFLCLKEAVGLEDTAREDLVAIARGFQEQFLREHLARWAPGFSRKALQAGRDTFHGSLARLLNAFLDLECRRMGVAMGDPRLEARTVPGPPPSSDFSCAGEDAPAERESYPV